MEMKLSDAFARDALLELHQDSQAAEDMAASAAAARLHRVRPLGAGTFERRGDIAIVWVYGRLVRIGSGEGKLTGSAIADAIKANATARAIFLRISSEGGSGFALNIAKTAIGKFRGRSIAVIDDCAYSAAAELAISCDRVIARRNARLMFHRQVAALCGNSEQIFDFVPLMRRADRETLRTIFSRVRNGGDRREIERAFNDERYLSAHEAQSLGLVDAIAPALLECDDLIATNEEEKTP